MLDSEQTIRVENETRDLMLSHPSFIFSRVGSLPGFTNQKVHSSSSTALRGQFTISLPSDSTLPSGLKHRKISATVGGSSENTCNHAGTDRTDLTPHYVRANTVQWTSGEIGPLAIDGRRSSVKAWLQRNTKDLSTGGCPYLSLDNCTLNKEVTE